MLIPRERPLVGCPVLFAEEGQGRSVGRSLDMAEIDTFEGVFRQVDVGGDHSVCASCFDDLHMA